MSDRDQFGDFAGPAQPPAQSIGGWQPIETAPKDGRDVLVVLGSKCHVARWSPMFLEWVVETPGIGEPIMAMRIGPQIVNGYTVLPGPTHWQPLPPPPAKHGGDR